MSTDSHVNANIIKQQEIQILIQNHNRPQLNLAIFQHTTSLCFVTKTMTWMSKVIIEVARQTQTLCEALDIFLDINVRALQWIYLEFWSFGEKKQKSIQANQSHWPCCHRREQYTNLWATDRPWPIKQGRCLSASYFSPIDICLSNECVNWRIEPQRKNKQDITRNTRQSEKRLHDVTSVCPVNLLRPRSPDYCFICMQNLQLLYTASHCPSRFRSSKTRSLLIQVSDWFKCPSFWKTSCRYTVI